MALLRIGIVDPVRGVKAMAELPDNIPLDRLLPTLVSKLGLPDQVGTSATYRVVHPRTGTYLDDHDTLADGGIQSGDVLRLLPATSADKGDTEKISRGKRLFVLKRLLDTRFDEGELRTLCFHLDVDYDGLLGDGKMNKTRELLTYLERRERIHEIVQAIKELRPDISLQRWNVA